MFNIFKKLVQLIDCWGEKILVCLKTQPSSISSDHSFWNSDQDMWFDKQGSVYMDRIVSKPENIGHACAINYM